MEFSKFIASSTLRKFEVYVSGYEEPLILTELSGKESIKRAKEAEAHEKNTPQQTFENMAWWVGRLLKGSNPKKEEVKLLIDNYSPPFISELYHKGLAYLAPNGDSDSENNQKK